MQRILEELLHADGEATSIAAAGRAEADEIRRKADLEAETYRRERRAEGENRHRERLDGVRAQTTDEEARILASADHEIAALRRRLDERRDALAETMLELVLPES